jgi:hypothetical protein
MDLKVQARCKKTDLVNAITEKWMDSNVFFAIFNLKFIRQEHIQTLHEIMDSDGTYYVEDAEDFPFDLAMLLLGLMVITAYRDGDRIGIIPLAEAKRKFSEFLDSVADNLDEILDELDDYARAAANLYGAIPIAEFFDIYRSQTESDFTEEDVRLHLEKILLSYDDDGAEYFIRDTAEGAVLASDSLESWDNKSIGGLVAETRTHPICILPKEEFLRYEDWTYYEKTEAHESLISFLGKKLRSDAGAGGALRDKDPEEITAQIVWMLRQWTPLQDVINIMTGEGGISFSDMAEANRVVGLLAEINNHSRIWGNNGARPVDILDDIPDGVPFRKAGPKTGRNDPCPCGSGRKYKHCCGRN